jgi:hypothetical protein
MTVPPTKRWTTPRLPVRFAIDFISTLSSYLLGSSKTAMQELPGIDLFSIQSIVSHPGFPGSCSLPRCEHCRMMRMPASDVNAITRFVEQRFFLLKMVLFIELMYCMSVNFRVGRCSSRHKQGGRMVRKDAEKRSTCEG